MLRSIKGRVSGTWYRPQAEAYKAGGSQYGTSAYVDHFFLPSGKTSLCGKWGAPENLIESNGAACKNCIRLLGLLVEKDRKKTIDNLRKDLTKAAEALQSSIQTELDVIVLLVDTARMRRLITTIDRHLRSEQIIILEDTGLMPEFETLLEKAAEIIAEDSTKVY